MRSKKCVEKSHLGFASNVLSCHQVDTAWWAAAAVWPAEVPSLEAAEAGWWGCATSNTRRDETKDVTWWLFWKKYWRYPKMLKMSKTKVHSSWYAHCNMFVWSIFFPTCDGFARMVPQRPSPMQVLDAATSRASWWRWAQGRAVTNKWRPRPTLGGGRCQVVARKIQRVQRTQSLGKRGNQK